MAGRCCGGSKSATGSARFRSSCSAAKWTWRVPRTQQPVAPRGSSASRLTPSSSSSTRSSYSRPELRPAAGRWTVHHRAGWLNPVFEGTSWWLELFAGSQKPCADHGERGQQADPDPDPTPACREKCVRDRDEADQDEDRRE